MKNFVFLVFIFSSQLGFSFILKPSTILSKAVENSGSGIYQIEQEVYFQTPGEPITLKEEWQVENGDKMKLTVTGTKDLKDKFKWVFLYDKDFRYQVADNRRISKKLDSEFIEKYLHIRKSQDLQNLFVQSKAVPSSIFNRSSFRHGKDPDVINTPFVRLARTGGVVTFAFGKLVEKSSDSPASFFIEQDSFSIRKIRIGSMEVSSDQFTQFPKGLFFPRTRTVKWNENTVQIQSQQITPRTERAILSQVEPSIQLQNNEFGAYQNLIEEFYKRFR